MVTGLQETALTRCERCDQGDRIAVRRAKAAEGSSRVAVVLEVPMEECSAGGTQYLAWDVAEHTRAFHDNEGSQALIPVLQALASSLASG